MTYLDYLSEMVDADPDYSILMLALYEMPFEFDSWDANRASDGLYLRELYRDDCGDEADADGHANILEVMVALCRHIENDYLFDYKKGNRTGMWFEYMLKSLNLYDITNTEYRKKAWKFQERIEKSLISFMDGNYNFNGDGGLFYIPTIRFDDVESHMPGLSLWDQMLAWIHYISTEEI